MTTNEFLEALEHIGNYCRNQYRNHECSKGECELKKSAYWCEFAAHCEYSTEDLKEDRDILKQGELEEILNGKF